MRTPFRHVLLLLFALLIQSCGGGGGGSSSNSGTTTPTPLTVDASSFVNKGATDLANFLVPDLSLITADGYASVAATLAVADFQQVGKYSAFVVGRSGGSARGYFLKFNSQASRWEDVSAELFYDAASGTHREACVGAEQSLVTKFNGDSAPDIYLVCSGMGGTAQYLYISRSDGKYGMVKTSSSPMNIAIDAKGASIADINNDGVVDVVSSHQRLAGDAGFPATVSVMLGSYNSTTDTYRLGAPTAVTLSASPPLPSSVRSVFLVPRPGRYDLIVAGDGGQGIPMMYYKNDGLGFFDTGISRAYALIGGDASSRYDYTEFDGNGYIYVTSSSTGAFVKLWRITKPETAVSSTALFKHSNSEFRFASPAPTQWSSRIVVQGGFIVPYDAGCADNPVKLLVNPVDQRCGQNYPIDKFTAN